MRVQMWVSLVVAGSLALAVAGCGTATVTSPTATAVAKPAGTAVAGAATAASGPAASTAVAAGGTVAAGVATAASGPAAGTAAAAAGTVAAGAVKPGATAAASVNITVPEKGTPKERLQQMWDATKPVIRADAAAQLSEAEIQTRRVAMTTPWAAIQAQITGGTAKDNQETARVVNDIMNLINSVYPPGTTKATVNQQTVDQQINTIDQAIRALP